MRLQGDDGIGSKGEKQTLLESMRVRGVYASGGALKEWGTRYSSASIRSSSSSSAKRLWKNLLSFGPGSFMQSSPWAQVQIQKGVAGLQMLHVQGKVKLMEVKEEQGGDHLIQ